MTKKKEKKQGLEGKHRKAEPQIYQRHKEEKPIKEKDQHEYTVIMNTNLENKMQS